jgi:hypothetical protein
MKLAIHAANNILSMFGIDLDSECGAKQNSGDYITYMNLQKPN